MKKNNKILWFLCILIVISSLIIGRNGEFSGADTKIEETIQELDSNYEPWFTTLWKPPSGEIESLLFTLQASIGAGFIGYYIGKKSNVKTNNSTIKEE